MNALAQAPEQQQLEISLTAVARRRQERQIRMARARWWFARMHRAVDAAAEPSPMARPGQLPLLLPSERKAA